MDVLQADIRLFDDGYELYGRMSREDLFKDSQHGVLKNEGVVLDRHHPIAKLIAGFNPEKGLVIAFDDDDKELGRKEFPINHDSAFGLDVEDSAALDDAANDLVREVLDGREA